MIAESYKQHVKNKTWQYMFTVPGSPSSSKFISVHCSLGSRFSLLIMLCIQKMRFGKWKWLLMETYYRVLGFAAYLSLWQQSPNRYTVQVPSRVQSTTLVSYSNFFNDVTNILQLQKKKKYYGMKNR